MGWRGDGERERGKVENGNRGTMKYWRIRGRHADPVTIWLNLEG